MTSDKLQAFADFAEKSFCAGTLKNVFFSYPSDKEVLKIKGTVK